MVPGDNIGLTRVTLQGWGGADLPPPSLPLGVSSEHPQAPAFADPPSPPVPGPWEDTEFLCLGSVQKEGVVDTQPQGMARAVHYQEKLHSMLAYQSCKEGLLTSHKQ